MLVLESCSWAKESIQIACKWGYQGVESGMTLAGKPSHQPVIHSCGFYAKQQICETT